MAQTKPKSKEKVQIDADWLLGESDERKTWGSSWFWSSMPLLICTIGAIWAWPHVSKRWLQWEWEKQLAQSTNKPTEDVLPILLALNDLNPQHHESIIQQLSSDDPEKRLVAFHLLSKRIETWHPSNPPSSSELATLTYDLQSMQSPSPESQMLRGQLAARLLRLVGSQTSNASRLRTSLEEMIAVAGSVSNPTPAMHPTPVQTASVSTTIAGLSDTPKVARRSIGDSPNSSVSNNPRNEVSVRIGDTSEAPRASVVEPPQIRRSSDTHFVTNTLPESKVSLDVTPNDFDNSLSNPKPSSNKPSQPQRDLSTQRQEPPRLASSQTIRMTDMSSAKPAPTAFPTVAKVGDGAPTEQPAVPLQGLDKKPIEQLLPLLASTQPRIVQQAADELLRKGLKPAQLEMAIRLAQGDASERILEMERLVRNPNLDPIPWLVWMAENSDRKVRHKAIALLGSMSSQDALHSLRMLKMREPDSDIADQITQVLLASGSARTSVR